MRLTDPDGYQVEVVHHGECASHTVQLPCGQLGRIQAAPQGRALPHFTKGPSHIKRFGHFVIMSRIREDTLRGIAKRSASAARTRSTSASKSNVVGSFNRLDRGEDYVDHHAFFCIRGEKSGLNHLSFEAADIDDVMVGHEHLEALRLPSHMGDRPPSDRQPVVRLLERSVGPRARALGRYRRAQRAEPRPISSTAKRDSMARGWQPIPEIFIGHASA